MMNNYTAELLPLTDRWPVISTCLSGFGALFDNSCPALPAIKTQTSSFPHLILEFLHNLYATGVNVARPSPKFNFAGFKLTYCIPILTRRCSYQPGRDAFVARALPRLI
jgi:hypothetical protein